MRGLFGLFCLLFCLGAHAREPLTVIYDSGDTLPIEPYLPKRAPQVAVGKRIPRKFELTVRVFVARVDERVHLG